MVRTGPAGKDHRGSVGKGWADGAGEHGTGSAAWERAGIGTEWNRLEGQRWKGPGGSALKRVGSMGSESCEAECVGQERQHWIPLDGTGEERKDWQHRRGPGRAVEHRTAGGGTGSAGTARCEEVGSKRTGSKGQVWKGRIGLVGNGSTGLGRKNGTVLDRHSSNKH